MFDDVSMRAPLAALILLAAIATSSLGQPVASFQRQVDQSELESWLAFRNPEASPRPVSGAARELVLQQLVLTRYLAEEALLLGLDQHGQARLELLRQRAGRARQALRRELTNSIQIGSEEAEAKYQAIKDTYTRPRRLRLRNLFLRFPPPGSSDAEAGREAVRQRMQALRQRVLDGEDFASLAEAESDSQTRLRGGLLGNVRAGTFPPAVDRVAMALQPGEVSEILAGKDGLTILFCEQILDRVVRSPEELRDIARDLLRNHRFRTEWAATEQRLLEEAAPVWRWAALRSSSPKVPLIQHAGGQLSVAEVASLALPDQQAGALRDNGEVGAWLAELPRERIRKRTEPLVLGQMLLIEADRRDTPVLAPSPWAEQQILASHALTRRIQERLQPIAASEIENYFADHGQEFERSLHFDLAVINLPMDSENLRASYRLGERVVHQLNTGELLFADAARGHSLHPSASEGGHLGWISRQAVPGDFGIDFLRALLRLEVGQRSDLVESEGRLWILELRGREEPRTMTLEEAWIAVENRLGNQQVQELEAEITARLLQQLELRLLTSEAGSAEAAKAGSAGEHL